MMYYKGTLKCAYVIYGWPLSHYSEEDKDLWLKPDVDATCEFMEFSSQFFNAMNLQECDAKGLDEETGSKVLKEISTYMRDVAMPSGKYFFRVMFYLLERWHFNRVASGLDTPKH